MALRPLPAPLAATALLAALLAAACVPDPDSGGVTAFDLKPPLLVAANPEGSRSLLLRFDEAVSPVEGSFTLSPGGRPEASAQGSELRITFAEAQVPGLRYGLAGEVVDSGGNGARFLLHFPGWNDHPAALRLSELITAKNSSTTAPHRDLVEFEVLAAGNLGGLELAVSNSVKTVSYSFPGVEVGAGGIVVLHCAPEGSAAEIDETGGDLLASGGVDASPALDLWSKAGGLPDASGILVLRSGQGGRPMDGIFYSEEAKTGTLGEGRIGEALTELLEAGLWTAAGTPAWEDAFRWKPSVSRSIQRTAPGAGPGACEWSLSESSAQTPGRIP